MGVTHYSKFDRYKKKITALSSPLQDNAITTDSFLLEKSDDQKISIYYSPVEYINEKAIVLIVGITPGFRQMKKAYAAVKKTVGLIVTKKSCIRLKWPRVMRGRCGKFSFKCLIDWSFPIIFHWQRPLSYSKNPITLFTQQDSYLTRFFIKGKTTPDRHQAYGKPPC